MCRITGVQDVLDVASQQAACGSFEYASDTLRGDNVVPVVEVHRRSRLL